MSKSPASSSSSPANPNRLTHIAIELRLTADEADGVDVVLDRLKRIVSRSAFRLPEVQRQAAICGIGKILLQLRQRNPPFDS